MPTWDWKEGMYGLEQPFTIKTPDGVPYDLTGHVVTLYVFKEGVQLFALVGILDGDPTTGKCYFTPINTNFPAASKGTYRFEIECTKAGVVVKSKNYAVEVTDTRP